APGGDGRGARRGGLRGHGHSPPEGMDVANTTAVIALSRVARQVRLESAQAVIARCAWRVRAFTGPSPPEVALRADQERLNAQLAVRRVAPAASERRARTRTRVPVPRRLASRSRRRGDPPPSPSRAAARGRSSNG